MAFIHGKDTLITVDSNDLSAFTNSSDFSQSSDSHDVTAYGATNKAYQAGLIDGTFSMAGIYDNAAGGPRTVLQALQVAGAAFTIIRQPEGAGTTLDQDSFSAIITSYEESSPVDDMINWTADFQISGVVTSTAQA